MIQDNICLDSIEDAILEIKKGKMVVVVDNEDRENEGDLIMAAEKITPEQVNFMAKYGRGLICTPISSEIAEKLELSPMVNYNTASHGTPFTVSVDLIDGNTTGISSDDRSRTILAMANPNTTPKQLARPGHIFPLVARDKGVLEREGHTEAAVDLARLAGFRPAGVLCEVMNDDGTMSRLPDLVIFARRFGLKLISIKDLKEFILKRQLLIPEVETLLPTDYGDFKLQVYIQEKDGQKQEHLAIIKGNPEKRGSLVRIHSECLTGDLLGSLKCDCGQQLDASFKQLGQADSGVIIYLRQEGRGIGLVNKLKAYNLQQEGLDTVEANLKLNLRPDYRSYEVAALILKSLGVSSVNLLTNNPEKIEGLERFGVEVAQRVPLEVEPNEVNASYLLTKKIKMGHLISNKESQTRIHQ